MFLAPVAVAVYSFYDKLRQDEERKYFVSTRTSSDEQDKSDDGSSSLDKEQQEQQRHQQRRRRRNQRQEGPCSSFKIFLEDQVSMFVDQPRQDPWKIHAREDGTFTVLDTKVPFPKIAYK